MKKNIPIMKKNIPIWNRLFGVFCLIFVNLNKCLLFILVSNYPSKEQIRYKPFLLQLS